MEIIKKVTCERIPDKITPRPSKEELKRVPMLVVGKDYDVIEELREHSQNWYRFKDFPVNHVFVAKAFNDKK